MNTLEQDPDLLADEGMLAEYEHATTGQRFLNYLIDNLFMNFALAYAMGAAIGYVFSLLNPDLAYRVFVAHEFKYSALIVGYIVGLFNYLVYYTLCEKLFKGVTLGKLITGTKAIREDGAALTGKDAIMRSLYRIIPFEVLSGFGGHPWHDTGTRTMVIKTR